MDGREPSRWPAAEVAVTGPPGMRATQTGGAAHMGGGMRAGGWAGASELGCYKVVRTQLPTSGGTKQGLTLNPN